MTKIVSIACPSCKNPLYGKSIDTVFLCPNCGTMHARNGKVTIIEYEAGAYTKASDGEKVYLPFWRTGVDFNIRHERVDGALLSRLAGNAVGGASAGHLDMFLPAFELEPMRYKQLATTLTLNAPKYAPERLDPAVKKEPCKVEVDAVDEMADFLFVTIEAEKPGTMQQLDYDLKVTSRKLVYLPFYRKNNELQPGY